MRGPAYPFTTNFGVGAPLFRYRVPNKRYTRGLPRYRLAPGTFDKAEGARSEKQRMLLKSMVISYNTLISY